MGKLYIPNMGELNVPCETSQVSDGYHTFGEIYEHRMTLFSILLNTFPDIAWKSKLHNDGTMFEGDYFIAGLELPTGMVTYHLKYSKYWDIIKVKELERAPEWDGHTSEDVISRLRVWSQMNS